ncbi:uncharacterized protein si:dkey-171c9.3 [Pangasianodon hypophthalmus]|uniref:uncharacterized protein si:dkey-171c9.3 n=1 Tax=Pangasianodon hypophthalmus TaxID=310915 RepID=UPI002307973B|nr:uncharacterized protein si:dkey-171c9.3 [Pangasianodon hypophthalmus]
MAEDWLCSRVKLCQLVTGPNVDLSNVQDPAEVVINTESYPPPHYNPSSILLTLDAFSAAFDELRGRRSNVKMNYMDQNALGPNPVQKDVVHHFAEMLSRDILDAAVRKQDTQSTKDSDQICNIIQSEMSRWTMSDKEKLAKRLAAEIYSNALEELARPGCPADRKSDEQLDVVQTTQTFEKEIISEIHSEPASYPCSSMHHCDQEGPTTEIDSIYHRSSTTNPTTLDDMAHLGSLDYPDAPPSTPLLPEMMKSRSSFTRKLKGGLAKEFLPSTPPPTPKDQQSLLDDKMTDSTVDKSEFMVRLMRSLSLACSQLGEDNGTENESRFQTEISDYAAQLSADIIQCITTAQAGSSRNIETPVRDAQVLADHLAEEIIITSIADVMRSKRENRTSQEIPSYFENTTQALSDTLSSESIPDIPPVEALRAMAGRLITNTLVQAFSELGSGSLQHATSKQLPDPASEPMPWEQGNDQYLNTSLHIKNSQQTQTNGCSNVQSESNDIPLDSRTGTVEHIFAENIVHEVLKCSIREASNCHLRCEQTSGNSGRLSSSVASQAVMRAFISETLCHDTQELQCVLLWAAASQMGISTLQIDLNDKHIQQQLCSICLQAQFQGWTVGHLMTSLLQHCDDLQTASRGHSKISTSLLGHLLLTQS